MEKTYYIYIMTNKLNGTLYTGITSDLKTRVWQHKNNFYPQSFTAKYSLHSLVYYEVHNDVNIAINREKQIKSGSREAKLKLITKLNKNWTDLYSEI